MKKGALRWARRVLALAACAGVLAAAVHTPWVRGLVLSQLTSALSARTGLTFSADTLSVNLRSLTVTVAGLQVTRPASPGVPILRVRQAQFDLSHRVLSGAIEAERVEADGVALVIDVSAHAGTPAGKGAPFKVPMFTIGHAVLRHASIEILDPGRPRPLQGH